ncbi:hypothetical protein JCM10212_005887 [Sporobolomyces blumeae]
MVDEHNTGDRKGQGRQMAEETRKRNGKGLTDEGNNPPGRTEDVASSRPKRKRPLSFERDVDEPRLGRASDCPEAGPSSLKRPAGDDARQLGTTESDPPGRSPAPSAVIELSSSSESEASRSNKRGATSSRPSPSKRVATGSPVKPSTATSCVVAEPSTGRGAGRGRGRPKPRLSMEQALEAAHKIKATDLRSHFGDIASFVEHLGAFERERPIKLLDGCRVCFVNADHWLDKSVATQGDGARTRNRFDQGLRLEMGIVAKRGGTLVRPEAFVGAPRDVDTTRMDPNEADRLAEAGGWTTHVIAFSPTNVRPPSFSEVLDCLGTEGIDLDELGSYAKVVTFKWVSKSVAAGKRQSEWEFAIEPDPRAKASGSASSTQVSSAQNSPKKSKQGEEVAQSKARRLGRLRGPKDDDATTDEEGDEFGEDEVMSRQVSPFDIQDYPAGERPPVSRPGGSRPDQDDDSDDRATENASSDSESSHGGRVVNGLEEEDFILRTLGADVVEAELAGEIDQAPKAGDELFLFSADGGVDDCETEEEEEEVRSAKTDGRKPKKVRSNEKDPTRMGYAVNRPFRDPATTEQGPNDKIADVLSQLLALSALHKGDLWRERGYRMAAGSIRRYKKAITKYEVAKRVPGIGESLAQKVVEISRTGTHRRLGLELPQDRAARIFSGVYGIGLASGHVLYRLGARTLDDLWNEPYFSHLSDDSKVGLKYHDDLQERIPRDEVTKLYEVVLRAARDVDPKLIVECMGSYRRGQADSGDIDILVTRDPSDGKTHSGAIGKMYRRLKDDGFFQHVLSESDDWNKLDCKVHGLCKLDSVGKMRRIDILGVPWPEMPAALIYFTGNDHFNRSLRLKARHLGYSLNQRGLYKSVIRDKRGEKLTEGTMVDCRSEQDIFDLLKVPWVPPEQRIPS